MNKKAHLLINTDIKPFNQPTTTKYIANTDATTAIGNSSAAFWNNIGIFFYLN